MKSLLYQPGAVFSEPPGCSVLPCRTEVPINIRKSGRIYRLVLRDKITVEDPYFMMVRAQAFATLTGEAYNGTPPARDIKDFLIKSSVVI